MRGPCAICLVAVPGDAHTRRVLNEVSKQFAGQTEWLSKDQALDVYTDTMSVPETILGIVEGADIDIVTIDPTTRRKRLFAADMDGTMITIECIDELADVAGARAHVEEITARAMSGELDFAAALRERVRCLEGLSLHDIEALCRERIRAMPGAHALLATLNRYHVNTILISGGFQQFTQYVADEIGFANNVGNSLEVRHNRLTGRVVGEIVDAQGKKAALEHFARSFELALSDALAVGDGANDRPMIEAAGLGVAFRAKPVLNTAASAVIRYSDLTALLYLQGYRQDELKPHG